MPSAQDKVLYIRNVPPELANKLKAAAALDGLRAEEHLPVEAVDLDARLRRIEEGSPR